jgi:hypothetical protein
MAVHTLKNRNPDFEPVHGKRLEAQPIAVLSVSLKPNLPYRLCTGNQDSYTMCPAWDLRTCGHGCFLRGCIRSEA